MGSLCPTIGRYPRIVRVFPIRLTPRCQLKQTVRWVQEQPGTGFSDFLPRVLLANVVAEPSQYTIFAERTLGLAHLTSVFHKMQVEGVAIS